ncbi:MAG: 16S rRNA (cytosine(1402)-N(4))-methyltransferase RsmH [Defluviitaleaceae bacterium]|nr:16S rRNA (cytosine(1402)-N(4))-methyltransferase RsmH [Defluviitaleaceae bacterium]
MIFEHASVMPAECLDGLNIDPDGLYVDCTAGGGGHSLEICRRLSAKGRLVCIDQDADALRETARRLTGYPITAVNDNFSNIEGIFASHGFGQANGFLADLGVSSYQLDNPERGFSYKRDAPLDMRMNRQGGVSAYEIVNEYSEERLRRIIAGYGEERWAERIAKFIIDERPLNTTFELVRAIKKAVPRGAREDGPHPAKRTFQAIRIEVNNELSILEPSITAMASLLASGGRLCVITFHSLEDRIVKNTFRSLENPCVCPRELPVCACNKRQTVKVLTRKPVLPGKDELEGNSRARSAKLRIAEKL